MNLLRPLCFTFWMSEELILRTGKNTEALADCLVGSNALADVNFLVSGGDLRSDSGFVLRNNWIAEADNVDALFQHFFRELACECSVTEHDG